ncbi:MAG: efflux RND transporter periplasmic adaptor subunit [Planctomycetes bacterium]|nr:efflux RND transporter periplasmic adaptor subunit [Planctomycetota bacterium]
MRDAHERHPFASTLRLYAAGIGAGLMMIAGAAAQESAPVRADVVQLESVQAMRTVTGTIVEQRRSIVASEQDGLVIEVPFDTGDTVKAGDILAVLDSDILQLEIQESQAQLAAAEATIDEYQADRDRLALDYESVLEMQQQGAAKPKEIDDARSMLDAAAARLTAANRSMHLAEVRVRLVERRLKGTVIKAPFDGVVVVKHTEVGQWMNIGGPVVEIIATSRMDAVLEVPERYIGHLAAGMDLSVKPASMNASVTGSIRGIIPLGDTQARTYPVKVALENPDGSLLPGMSVSGLIPTGDRMQAITVNQDAITMTAMGSVIYVIRDGRVSPVPIEAAPGASAGRVVANGQGLAEGDLVVIEGNERLYPGAGVQIVNASEFAAGSSEAPPTVGEGDDGDDTNPQTRKATYDTTSADNG